jgi:hypothetical protein
MTTGQHGPTAPSRLGPILTAVLAFILGAASAAVVLRPRGRSAGGEPPEERPVVPAAARLDRPLPERPAPAAAGPAPVAEGFPSGAAQSGPPTLDPAFVGRIVPLLTRSLGALAARKRGNLVEVRCQSRACLVRLSWPPEAEGARDEDPALFAPPEPGCTVEMSPARPEQLRTGAPAQVSFLYECPRWVEQAIEGAPSADDQVTTTETTAAAAP